LANWFSSPEYNCFTAQNGMETLNPVDVLCMFLFSTDREIARYDANGAATSMVVSSASSFGVADQFIGCALHCVEGDNKFSARPITDNATDSCTVSPAFANAPADGNEYQIRNSVYDVLPVGWGLGCDCRMFDLDSIAKVRSTFLSRAVLGRFVLGDSGELDLWDLLKKNIMEPYGLYFYFDCSTRKIKLGYLCANLTDGVMYDYTSLSSSDFRSEGSLDHEFVPPIGRINLSVRGKEDRITSIDAGDYSQIPGMAGLGRVSGQSTTTETRDAGLDGSKTTFTIRAVENENAFADTELDTLDLSAVFDTEDSAHFLVSRLSQLVSTYSVPPPCWQGQIDVAKYVDLALGSWVSMTWASFPTNPHTGARGWSSAAGRVLEKVLLLDSRALEFTATIEMHAEIGAFGLISPGSTVTAKGNDGNGDYFTVNDNDWTAEQDRKDWYGLAVGDLITWRSTTGVVVRSGMEITGFGTNFASTPETAVGSRVYVDDHGLDAVSSGDYLILDAWSANNTTNMDTFSAYADGATGLLTGGDAARKYA
jgi:hypothetical protein